MAFVARAASVARNAAAVAGGSISQRARLVRCASHLSTSGLTLHRQMTSVALRSPLPVSVLGQLRSFSAKPLATPSFGAESITEGTIMEWKVKAGQSFNKGDILVVIETDKVTVEVNAEESGTMGEIMLKEDDTAEVGKTLCTYTPGPGGAAAPASKPADAAPAKPAAAAAAAGGPEKVIEVMCPEFGAESITEGTMQEWKFKVGDYVNKGQIIAAIETDKVTVEVAAEDSGVLTEICIQAEETAEVGKKLCSIKTGGAPPPDAAPAAEVPAAPAAPAPAAKAEAPAAPAAQSAAAAADRPERRIKMPRMRMAIAKNLKNAQDTQAALSTFQEVDMSPFMEFRKQYKDTFEAAHNAKLGFQSIFIKAAANALMQIPSINACVDGKDLVFREYVDIGFAAASPRGLVVPVIRNVEQLSIVGVEREFAALAKKAKEDKIQLSDMEGGTFNISNGGVFGSMLGTPMIGSTSISAVMGLHATKMRPVVLPNGSIAARPIMYVALTYDHRLVDGREAVTFLTSVRDQVENPERMLLGL